MKLKLVVIDLEIPAPLKRWLLRLGIPLVVLTASVFAAAAVPKTWVDREVLTAKDLNDNFSNLESRLAALESARRRTTSCRFHGVPQRYDVSNRFHLWTGNECDNGLPKGKCVGLATGLILDDPSGHLDSWVVLTPGEDCPWCNQGGVVAQNGGMYWWISNAVPTLHTVGIRAAYVCDP